MTATVDVSHLIEKLGDVLNDKEMNSPSLRKQIKNAKEKLEHVDKLLTEAESKQTDKQTVNADKLEAELLQHVHSAADIVESFIIKTSLQRLKFFAKVRPLQFFTRSQTLTRGMKDLVEEIDKACAKYKGTKKHSLENKEEHDQPSLKVISDDQPTQEAEPSISEATSNVSDQQTMDAPKPSVSTEQPVAQPSKSEARPSSAVQEHMEATLKSSLSSEPIKSEATPNIANQQDASGFKSSLSAEKPVVDSISGEPGAQTLDPTMPEEKQVRSQSSTTIFDDEMDFIGRKNETNELAEAMFSRHKLRFLISVVGAGGCGKTTFVRNVYNRVDVAQHFLLRAWVNASEEFLEENQTEDVDQKTKNLLIDVLKQVTTIKEEERLPREQVEEKVRDIFIRKRFLIVLDDVRALAVWDYLKRAFPNSLNGSRLIFITREMEIAKKLTDPGFPTIKLENLQIDESWTLFLKKTHKTDESLNEIGPLLKEQIWEKCKGLPLAIVVLGGLLSFKDPRLWENEVRRVNFGDDPSKAVLALAYQDLPLHLKPCLLYLGLFPKECVIPARRLYRLWAAERFAKGENPEDLVESYLEMLIRRNMIEVAKWRLDGSPKKCRMPGLVYDNVFPYALEKWFLHVHKTTKQEQPPPNIRRVATYVDISDSCTDTLRSYVSFNTRKGDTPADEVDRFLNKIIGKKGFGLLTVLDLEGVYKPVLSEAIGKLLQLSYLGLRWTFLDSIPNSVGDLPCLETLDVKHTNISSLPISIWNSKKLRHLYMNEIYLDVSLQKPLSSESAKLLTLWGLIIGKRSPPKEWMSRLEGIRKLGLTCHSESLKQITSWISRCNNLKSLKLRSIDEFGRPADLRLGTMGGHSVLSELYLLGKLAQGIDDLQLPQNLKMLTLSVSELKIDPMQVLGKLRNLKILRLFGRSYLGRDMTCKKGEFLELRVLKLWVLEELENWTVEEGSMPCLRELEIRRCEKLLIKNTSGLQQLTTLNKVTITNMPREFVAELQRSMGNKVKVNEWSFSPLPKQIDSKTVP